MDRYLLSVRADEDIAGIARTSAEAWGLTRAATYILGLHETFLRLADFPAMGRDASRIRPGSMRIETAGHVIFYRRTKSGILILRVLHSKMDVERHA